MTTPHTAILIDVAENIRNLPLDEIGDNVHVLTIADDREDIIQKLPAVTVSPFGREMIEPSRSTNVSDMIGYPAFIVFLDGADRAQSLTALDQRLQWRAQVVDHFIENSLRTTDGVEYWTTIEPDTTVDPGAWFDRKVFAGAVMVRCKHRKQRRRA